MEKPRIYLDWNASAPLRQKVKSTVSAALDTIGNPSSIHYEGRNARGLIEKSRSKLAEVCNCDSDQIIFTSGSTEAAALCLKDKNLESALIEHECVRVWTQGNLPVLPNGIVEVMNPEYSTLQIANGETGVIQNIPNGLAVTDATQAVGKIEVKNILKQAQIAFFSAHKLGGPKGVGAIIMNRDVELLPHLRGGGQELGRRSGTENIIGIAGFATAIKEANEEVKNGVWQKVEQRRNLLEAILLDSVPSLIIFGRESCRLPNTSYFAGLGWKNQLQLIDLDLSGFAVSAGSACSSGKLHTSTTLEAMGIDKSVSECAIRVSIGPETKEEDIIRFAETWIEKYKRNTPVKGKKF